MIRMVAADKNIGNGNPSVCLQHVAPGGPGCIGRAEGAVQLHLGGKGQVGGMGGCVCFWTPHFKRGQGSRHRSLNLCTCGAGSV
jgi:hypothetical protein